jgi:isochorismate synthase
VRSVTILVQDDYVRVKTGFEKIEDTCRTAFASKVLQVPSIDFTRKIAALAQSKEIFYQYISPDASLRFLTVGEIYRRSLSGTSLNAAEAIVYSSFTVLDESGKAEFPLLFLQKMFNKAEAPEWSDFEDSVFIPEFVFLQDSTSCYIIQNSYKEHSSSGLLETTYATPDENTRREKFTPVLPDDPEDKTQWEQSISEMRDAIISGTIQKAVLSRHMQYSFNTEPKYTAVAGNLEKQTSAYRFSFQRGNSFIAGASPEKLFSIEGNTIYSEAIAGSAKRGSTGEEDMINAAGLMNSEKERFEHDCVVQFIASALRKHARSVTFNQVPEIKKLLRIMHLRTEIKAEEIQHADLDNVISDLYPTPATCGEPKEIAYELINRLETHSRGLYCGLSGWLTNKQNGNFFILLRLALLKNKQMHVYAGCGIVKDSDADREYEESQYKAESIIKLFYNEDK